MTTVQPENPSVNDGWFNTETGEFRKFDGEKWVKVVCEICGVEEDLRRAPLMTGIPSSAEELKSFEVQTIFGTFWHEGRDAGDARTQFWEWYNREEGE